MCPAFISPAFLGLNAPYDNTKSVLIGCPMDDTSSYRPGSRFGPRAIRNNSLVLETYSPSIGADLQEIPFTDMGDLDLPFGKKERAIEQIAQAAANISGNQKRIVAIGGEHLISLPLITEHYKTHKGLKIIHLDAHADLRDEYQGEILSHATVMKRVLDIVGGKNLYQVGIRSGTKKEFTLMKEIRSLYGCDEPEIRRLKKSIKHSPCYISVDLDILDPGIFPATGTPEPGGLSFNKLLKIIYALKGLNVIGVDVVEYNPLLDPSFHCAVAAAKLIREMLLLFYS